jgi:hypothetical protein
VSFAHLKCRFEKLLETASQYYFALSMLSNRKAKGLLLACSFENMNNCCFDFIVAVYLIRNIGL